MEIANPNLLLKPGMQAVTKLTQSNRKGLFIPIDATEKKIISIYGLKVMVYLRT
jgi:hypothetical protein